MAAMCQGPGATLGYATHRSAGAHKLQVRGLSIGAGGRVLPHVSHLEHDGNIVLVVGLRGVLLLDGLLASEEKAASGCASYF